MKKTIYDILNDISQLPSQKEKVQALQSNQYASTLKTVFAYMLDQNIKWLLPEGDPPYKPCEFLDVEGRFLPELRKLYLFVEGGNPNLTQLRRETLFIQLLESIDPKDAKLLLAMKDRKIPFKGFNRGMIRQAFPDLVI